MKQVKYQILFFAILFGVTTQSCKEEMDINIDITSNSWEVVKIKKQGESSYTEAEESYILDFISDTTYTLKLDVNNCYGDYEIIDSGHINITAPGCTEVCCDTDFAADLAQLLPKMTEYYGSGNKLILEGQGEIILKEY